MNFNAKVLTFLVCLFSILSVSTVSAQSKKEDKEQISRLLIIVLVGNPENRKTFEDEIHVQLSLKGYASKPSYETALNTGEKITREDVIKVVEENNYDGVLVLKLIDFKDDMSYSTDRPNYNQGVYFNNYAFNYYQQNWDVVRDLKVIIQTDLFLSKDKSLLYSETSPSLRVDQNEEFIGKFSKKLVNKLIKGKYLKKNE